MSTRHRSFLLRHKSQAGTLCDRYGLEVEGVETIMLFDAFFCTDKENRQLEIKIGTEFEDRQAESTM